MLKRLGYFEAVKKEIEDMYTQSGNTKVTVVVHSMGGPVSLYFFTSGIVTQQWKDTHINAYITLSGCLLYTSPSPRDATLSRMPSSA